MQLGIESQIPDGLLAANALLAENSRQGVPTSTRALHRGFEFAISSTYKGFQFRCYETASDPVDAPNKTPWYKNPCVQSALAKGAASTALDALGTLPEGGTIAAAFSGFYGAAGVSNGNKILGRVGFAGGLLSTAGAAHDLQGPQDSALSTTLTGLQAAAGGAGIAKGLIEDIPVAGQIFAAVSVGLDLLGTGVEVYNCHP